MYQNTFKTIRIVVSFFFLAFILLTNVANAEVQATAEQHTLEICEAADELEQKPTDCLVAENTQNDQLPSRDKEDDDETSLLGWGWEFLPILNMIFGLIF